MSMGSASMGMSDSSRKSLLKMARAARKLVASLVILIALVVLCAYVVHANERPLEEAAHVENARLRGRSAKMIDELFGFYDVPADRGLSGDTCVSAYDGFRIPPSVEYGVSFPEQDGVYLNSKAPAAETWIKTSDNITRCAPRESGCHLRCLLRQPKLASVLACREDVPSNPAYFDPFCLSSSERCPNCNILRRRVGDHLKFKSSSGSGSRSGSGNRVPNSTPRIQEEYLQVAELYQRYRADLEEKVPVNNWDWPGSLFFSFTILTTVGYGNYAPTTDASKIIVAVIIVPGIAVFGYALAQVAEVLMGFFLFVKEGLGLKRARPKIDNAPRKWAEVLTALDTDDSQDLTEDEIVAGSRQIFELMGLENGNDPRTIRFLRDAFRRADEDGVGALSMMEAMAMMNDLVRDVEARDQENDAREQLIVSAMAFVPLVVAGSMGFAALERQEGNEYSTLDGFYFLMVSLTTLGLGDITPSSGPSQNFWYFYMVVGLGILAVTLSSMSDLFAAMSERIKLEAPGSSKASDSKPTSAPGTRVCEIAQAANKDDRAKYSVEVLI